MRQTTADFTLKTKEQFTSLQTRGAPVELSRGVHSTLAPSCRRGARVVPHLHSSQRFSQGQRWIFLVFQKDTVTSKLQQWRHHTRTTGTTTACSSSIWGANSQNDSVFFWNIQGAFSNWSSNRCCMRSCETNLSPQRSLSKCEVLAYPQHARWSVVARVLVGTKSLSQTLSTSEKCPPAEEGRPQSAHRSSTACMQGHVAFVVKPVTKQNHQVRM